MGDYLGIYLNDHLMGATAGLELFRRAAANLPEVAPLVQEIEQDRESLLSMIGAVGSHPDQLKVVAGWVSEKLGRLKLNGHLLDRSPLSDLVELEGLTLGVRGKLGLWRLLLELGDPRIDRTELERLAERAERQLEQLEALRLEQGVTSLRSGGATAPAAT